MMEDSGIFSKLFGARGTSPELPFNAMALVTRTIIFLQRTIFANRRGYGAYAYAPISIDLDTAIDAIADKIQCGTPFMAGKIGTTDGEALARYIDIHAKEPLIIKTFKLLVGKRGPFWWDNTIRGSLECSGGVFPVSTDKIDEFCRIFSNSCKDMDFIIGFTAGQYRLQKLLCSGPKIVEFRALTPCNHTHTWYTALKNKKVLVVHPYSQTIRFQYEKNVEFHAGQGPLPRFKELITYRPVNSIGGHNDEFPDWKTALQHMVDDISQIEFDVALLGCGLYGIPLSAHIKRMGKIAIYTGGSTQIVFGIKGKRWDNAGFYNEHWTRPFKSDMPKHIEDIESGCFI